MKQQQNFRPHQRLTTLKPLKDITSNLHLILKLGKFKQI